MPNFYIQQPTEKHAEGQTYAYHTGLRADKTKKKHICLFCHNLFINIFHQQSTILRTCFYAIHPIEIRKTWLLISIIDNYNRATCFQQKNLIQFFWVISPIFISREIRLQDWFSVFLNRVNFKKLTFHVFSFFLWWNLFFF